MTTEDGITYKVEIDGELLPIDQAYARLESKIKQLQDTIEVKNKDIDSLIAVNNELRDQLNEAKQHLKEMEYSRDTLASDQTSARRDLMAAKDELEVRQYTIERQEGEIAGLKFAIEHFAKRA